LRPPRLNQSVSSSLNFFSKNSEGSAQVRKDLNAGAAKVIAIEPSPEALESLRRNMAPEIAAGKVVLVPEGEGAKEIRIPVTTVDLISAELQLTKIDLIKAYVNGASERVLHGSVKTIATYLPRFVISTEEEPEDPKALAEFLVSRNAGYKARGGPCLYTGDAIRSDTMFSPRISPSARANI
jgi:hypothetical protein